MERKSEDDRIEFANIIRRSKEFSRKVFGPEVCIVVCFGQLNLLVGSITYASVVI